MSRYPMDRSSRYVEAVLALLVFVALVIALGYLGEDPAGGTSPGPGPTPAATSPAGGAS